MLRRPEYLQCYSKGRRYFSRSFVVFVLAAGARKPVEVSGHRLGVGIGRKAGNAVLRNRFKRLVREFYRLQPDALLDGLDIVVVPKKGLDIRRLTQQSVTNELVPLLHRARNELSPNATASDSPGGVSPCAEA